MGTYLCIGLASRLSIGKKTLANLHIDRTTFINALEQTRWYPSEIYTEDEPVKGNDDGILRRDQDYISFVLREDVMARHLQPLLQAVYPILYQDPCQKEAYEKVLEYLRSQPPNTWMEKARTKGFPYFQLSDFDCPETVPPQGQITQTLRMNVDDIILSMEGKTFMEEYGRQFAFFKYCIKEAWKDNPLAGALRVFLTE